MGIDSKNDMELIQRNLEQFLMEDLSADPAYRNRQQKSNRVSYTSEGLRAEERRGQNDRRDMQRQDIDLIIPAYTQPDLHRNPGKRNVKAWEPEEWESEDWEEETREDEDWEEDEWEDERDKERGTNYKAANAKMAGSRNTKSAGAKRQRTEREAPGLRRAEQVKISGRKKSPARKKGKGKKLLLGLGILFIVGVLAWYLLISAIYGKMSYNRSEELAGTPLKSEGVYNILLIGNDSRSEGDDGRSDAMILLSITNKTKSIQMISLLRDMYVEIPGHDGNRLNAAYAYGGPELLIETIKENLGIEVNRYVVVNFQAFANLVDAVGGVDLELTNEEVQWVNAYLNEYNMLRGMPIDTDYLDTSLSGMIHLNGPQALAYSRNRYIGTDFGRTERQRKILSAVIKKLPLTAFTNMGELVDGLFPNLTTNLTKGECMRLSLQAPKLVTYELVQSSIPVEGSYSNATIRGMAVLQVDFEANKRYLREQIYGE